MGSYREAVASVVGAAHATAATGRREELEACAHEEGEQTSLVRARSRVVCGASQLELTPGILTDPQPAAGVLHVNARMGCADHSSLLALAAGEIPYVCTRLQTSTSTSCADTRTEIFASST